MRLYGSLWCILQLSALNNHAMRAVQSDVHQFAPELLFWGRFGFCPGHHLLQVTIQCACHPKSHGAVFVFACLGSNVAQTKTEQLLSTELVLCSRPFEDDAPCAEIQI